LTFFLIYNQLVSNFKYRSALGLFVQFLGCFTSFSKASAKILLFSQSSKWTTFQIELWTTFQMLFTINNDSKNKKMKKKNIFFKKYLQK